MTFNITTVTEQSHDQCIIRRLGRLSSDSVPLGNQIMLTSFLSTNGELAPPESYCFTQNPQKNMRDISIYTLFIIETWELFS
jgi:hypothetical protein